MVSREKIRGGPILVSRSGQSQPLCKIAVGAFGANREKENPTTFKARLRVRGGELKGTTYFDTTSPTAARVSTKILLVLAAVFHWSVKCVDISQSFLQSEMMAPHQRVRISPPKCIPCPWLGKVTQEEKNRSDGVVLCDDSSTLRRHV